jgi:predicted GIY-YIG superfamily endonuclease
MATYYVYLLRCFDGTFYTGVTNDIHRRFAEQPRPERGLLHLHATPATPRIRR